MNKLLLVLLFSTAVCINYSNAQTKDKYLLSVEGNGGLSRNENLYGKNSQLNGNLKLYAGKFITPKTAVYTSFGFENYASYKTISNKIINTDTNTFKRREYIITPIVYVGIRKYFSVIKNNVAGLFTNIELGYGKNVKRNKYIMYYTPNPLKQQATETSTALKTNISFGAYLNVGNNWQVLLTLGGFHYWYNGKKDKDVGGLYIITPEKGSNAGINFNSQTLQLSFTKIL